MSYPAKIAQGPVLAAAALEAAMEKRKNMVTEAFAPAPNPVVQSAKDIAMAGPTVMMNFPHKVVLTLQDYSQIVFQAGPQPVPESLEPSQKDYLKANGVVPYTAEEKPALATLPPALTLADRQAIDRLIQRTIDSAKNDGQSVADFLNENMKPEDPNPAAAPQLTNAQLKAKQEEDDAKALAENAAADKAAADAAAKDAENAQSQFGTAQNPAPPGNGKSKSKQ